MMTDEMPLSEAATILGVTQQQAQRLAAMTPIEVARFTRRRATITSLRLTIRMAPDTLAAYLRNTGVKPTGLMSPLAVEWGLAGDGARRSRELHRPRSDGTSVRGILAM